MTTRNRTSPVKMGRAARDRHHPRRPMATVAVRYPSRWQSRHRSLSPLRSPSGSRRTPGRRLRCIHERDVRVHAVWDLSSLLGLTTHGGLLTASGTPLPAKAMRELLTHAVRVRRMLIDPDNGELLDLTPTTWAWP